MNYIKSLEAENLAKAERLLVRAERVQEFREHLFSPKFNPVQSDGSRGDWIAIKDVFRWLQYLDDVDQPYVY